MLQELLYTSHQGEGLKKGTGGGFCTVLSSNAMAPNLAQALEKLSGYKHPFDAHDPRAVHNPVNYRFCSLRIGGKAYHVFSRISDYRAEHTGRTNKLAHHLVADAANRPACGPAVILASPLMRSDWDSVPRLVPPLSDSALSLPEAMATACETWKRVAGDAGWAGALAEKLMSSEDRPVSVIYPGGAEPLDLIAELLALLPAEHRWSIPFSTYFTTLPPSTSCRLRFFLDDTQEAIAVRRDFRQETIDLTNARAALTSTQFTDAARAGIAFPISRPHQSTTPGVGTPQAGRERLDFALQSVEASEDDLTLIPEIRGSEPDARLLPPPIRESAVTRPLRAGVAPPDLPGPARNPRQKDRFGVGFIAGIAVGLLLGVCFSYVVLLNTRPPRTVDLAEAKSADQKESKLAYQQTEARNFSPEDQKSPESSSDGTEEAFDPNNSDSENDGAAQKAGDASARAKDGNSPFVTGGQTVDKSDGEDSQSETPRNPETEGVAQPPAAAIPDPSEEEVVGHENSHFQNKQADDTQAVLQLIAIDFNLIGPGYEVNRIVGNTIEIEQISGLVSAVVDFDSLTVSIDQMNSELMRDFTHAVLAYHEKVGSSQGVIKYVRLNPEYKPTVSDIGSINRINLPVGLGLENKKINGLRVRAQPAAGIIQFALTKAGNQESSVIYDEFKDASIEVSRNGVSLGHVPLNASSRSEWRFLEQKKSIYELNSKVHLNSLIQRLESDSYKAALSALNEASEKRTDFQKNLVAALSGDLKANLIAWAPVGEKAIIESIRESLSLPIIEAYIPADESRSLPERVVARYSIKL